MQQEPKVHFILVENGPFSTLACGRGGAAHRSTAKAGTRKIADVTCTQCLKQVERIKPGSTAPAARCADCGVPGERTGHQTCQYPQSR